MLLSFLVVYMWFENHSKNIESNKNKVALTGRFSSQQFGAAIQDNIRTLENLKSRIEETNGEYFEFWKYDAELIIEQASSIMFIEWIDSSAIVREVTPRDQNKEAIGLDISELDYRNADWLTTKQDSLTNVTHWLELVQGNFAFLIDAPLFFNNHFHGTITAGMDFQDQFDEIMLGSEMYYVEVKDEKGTVFYQYGDNLSTEKYSEYAYEADIPVTKKKNSMWHFRIVPNQNFMAETAYSTGRINLVLGLILCIFLSVTLYFMQKSRRSQASYKEANRKLRTLIDTAPMAIYIINPEGKVIDFWNKAAEDMLGWTREEAIGNFMPHVGDDFEDDFHRLMQETLKGKQIKEKELVRARKDGSKIHVRLNVGPLVDSGGGQQMLVLLEDMTRQKEIQQQLKNSLDEKEVLLMEVHHRVKNNLAIITGLIELQTSGIDDEILRDMLKETQNRIYSIAGVHEMLYKAASFSDISFESYAKKLVNRITELFEGDDQDIEIENEIEVDNLNMNQAIPLGLLLNELVTNSYKHAFRGRKSGKIWISMKQRETRVEVGYRDDGPGFDPEKFEKSNSLGLTLIQTLLHQLYAEYEFDMSEGFGLSFNFESKTKGSHSNL